MSSTDLMTRNSVVEEPLVDIPAQSVTRPFSRLHKSNDSHLIDETLAGDNDAFSALVQPYLHRFTTGIHRILQDDQDTQDALREALVSIRSKLRRFVGRRAFSLWAYRICLDEAVMLRRFRMRQREESTEDFMARFSSGFDQEGRVRESKMEARQFLMEIREALVCLPEEQRSVFVLRDFEGMNSDDVARKLSITCGLVRKHLHQARIALSRSLARSSVAAS